MLIALFVQIMKSYRNIDPPSNCTSFEYDLWPRPDCVSIPADIQQIESKKLDYWPTYIVSDHPVLIIFDKGCSNSKNTIFLGPQFTLKSLAESSSYVSLGDIDYGPNLTIDFPPESTLYSKVYLSDEPPTYKFINSIIPTYFIVGSDVKGPKDNNFTSIILDLNIQFSTSFGYINITRPGEFIFDKYRASFPYNLYVGPKTVVTVNDVYFSREVTIEFDGKNAGQINILTPRWYPSEEHEGWYSYNHLSIQNININATGIKNFPSKPAIKFKNYTKYNFGTISLITPNFFMKIDYDSGIYILNEYTTEKGGLGIAAICVIVALCFTIVICIVLAFIPAGEYIQTENSISE